jgi:hypothetical protein
MGDSEFSPAQRTRPLGSITSVFKTLCALGVLAVNSVFLPQLQVVRDAGLLQHVGSGVWRLK